MNSLLLFPKKRIKNNIPAHSGVSSLPYKRSSFKKLVLSRSSARHIGDDFSPLGAFVRACNNYPRMMIYLCHTPASGTWLGSTPEILLSGQGKEWHTVAHGWYNADAGRSDADKLGQEEPRRTGLCG